MKSLAFALSLTLLVPGFEAPSAQQSGQASAPMIAFDSAPDFLKLPEGMNFGEVPGVAVDGKGHIYVFSRSGSAAGPAGGSGTGAGGVPLGL